MASYEFHNSKERDFEKYEKLIEEIARVLNEPLWAEKIRKKAFSLFLSHPSIDSFSSYLSFLDNFSIFISPSSFSYFSPCEVCAYAHFQDTSFCIHSHDSYASSFLFLPLYQALKEQKSILKRALFINEMKNNPFYLFNTSFWISGMFLYVPSSLSLSLPFHTHFHLMNHHILEKTIVFISPQASITYLETAFSSPSSPLLHLGNVNFFLSNNSCLNFFSYKEIGSHTISSSLLYISGKKNSRAHFSPFFSSSSNRSSLFLYSSLSHSVFSLFSLSLLLSQSKLKEKIKIDAKESNIYASIKSMLDNESKGESLIEINAKKSEIYSSCDAFLSPFCSFSTEPIIKGDEYSKVRHEAIMRGLEQHIVNYLRTRGMTQDEIIHFLLLSYSSSFLSSFPYPYSHYIEEKIKELMKKEGEKYGGNHNR